VTKKEIVKTISEECNLTQLVTKKVVQMTFEAIIETLVSEGRIELRNFGVFEVKKRAARKARNPRSGEKVFVPEKFVVTFKPGKEMEEQVLALQNSGQPLPFVTRIDLDDDDEDDTPPTPAAEPPVPPPVTDGGTESPTGM
jgi:nucleoid DNA-binding protein